MLILAVVTINLVINGGLFGQATTAAEETRAASVDEAAYLWRVEAVFMNEEDIDESREERVWELYRAGLINEEQREDLIDGKTIEIGTRTNIHFRVDGFRLGGRKQQCWRKSDYISGKENLMEM